MTATKIATGFGLRDVAIAVVPTAPDTTPVWIDVPSVESAAFKLNVEQVEQFGDDRYQGTFYHSQKGTITVKGNKLSMRVFEMLTGTTVTSDAGMENLYFGTENELIPPRVMVRGIVPVRYEDGTTGQMTIYWFNCDCTTVFDSIPGGERAKLAEVNLTFNSYVSTTDERGNALPASVGSAFGRFEL